jgi:hypothetical protein
MQGEVNLELEWTLPEMLGSRAGQVTIEDLQYACALSSTRCECQLVGVITRVAIYTIRVTTFEKPLLE